MSTQHPETPAVEDPHARMEQNFIQEYLREQGYTAKDLEALPEEVARQLMIEASQYASAKLTEVEARAHLVGEVHGVSPHH